MRLRLIWWAWFCSLPFFPLFSTPRLNESAMRGKGEAVAVESAARESMSRLGRPQKAAEAEMILRHLRYR